MIWESAYWKEDLFRQAADLKRSRHQKRWLERSLARLEKTVMIGFYAVRKLIEAKRLSDAIRGSSIHVVQYRPTGKRVNFMNWHRADKLYFLDKPVKSQLTLERLSNIFIHSYTFLPVHNEDDGLEAILVNSDRTRSDGLFQVAIDDVIKIFSVIASDDPHKSQMIFDDKIGDYEVSLS
jgi:hypothetical protein